MNNIETKPIFWLYLVNPSSKGNDFDKKTAANKNGTVMPIENKNITNAPVKGLPNEPT